MLVRKMSVANLEVGKVYVAFSAKSKMLSSNGDKGVFVLVEAVGKDVKVNILHLNKSMVIKNLDGREDAWLYSPDDSLKIQVDATGKELEFPKFTPRMQDAFQGKEIKFDPSAVYKHEREGEGNGMYFYRFRGDDDKMNTFNFAWIAPNTAPEWRIPRAQRMGVGAIEIKLPPKPVSAEEQTLIESLSAAIAEFNKNKREDSCASYVIVGDNGVIIDRSFSAACHASLSRSKGGKWVISGLKSLKKCNSNGGVLTQKEYDDHINWLVNDSPFAKAFAVKSLEWIKANGFILTGDISAQLLCGACIATRQLWEYPQFVKAWYGLAEQGIPMNLAYVFGSYAVTNGKDWGWGAGNTGHTVFNLSIMGDEQLVNFNDGKAVKQNKEPYTEKGNYYGVNELWGTDTQSSVFGKLKAIGGKGRYGASNYIAFDDSMEQAADIIEDWIKKEGV